MVLVPRLHISEFSPLVEKCGAPHFSMRMDAPHSTRCKSSNGKDSDSALRVDVLANLEKSLLGVELNQRREVLQAIAANLSDPIRLSGSLQADPADLIAAGKEQGIEGFIAKRSTSLYEPGRRTGTWAKYKIHKGQELVIGGYRVGQNGFDNVAVGYYEGPKLMLIAKVRNGFTSELRRKAAARFKELNPTGAHLRICRNQRMPVAAKRSRQRP